MPDYPPIVEQILRVGPHAYAELSPTKGPSAEVRKLLESVTFDQLFRDSIASPVAAYAALAGLWLWHDGLDQCHKIVQQSPEELLSPRSLQPQASKPQALDSRQLRELETTLAYWHGIVHRREPDASNAKYWFRRVGRHAIFAPLVAQARALIAEGGAAQISAVGTSLGAGDWAPFQFIDQCERVRGSGSPEETLCVRIAQLEWRLLFDYCWQAAVGM